MKLLSLCTIKHPVPQHPGSSVRILTAKRKRFAKTVNLLRIAGAAAASLVVCSPLFLAARPKTPLRVLCVATFDYLARLRGRTLGRTRRVAIAHACDFGSLCDAYYDEQKLDMNEYRSLRRALRATAPEPATIRYMRELRKAERGRPTLAAGTHGVPEAVLEYRAVVIEKSLRWMHEIADLPPDDVTFQSLLNLVCLMQLADDLLDWKDDLATQCPGYVTALLLQQPRTNIPAALRALADDLLRHTATAAREDPGAIPFAFAGQSVWAFVVVLLKVCSLK
jgi:hypothetical protein